MQRPDLQALWDEYIDSLMQDCDNSSALQM